MSNRGQRPRIYDTPLNLCLEGSTPQDRYLHQSKDFVVAPGEPIFYYQRQLFCFLGA